MGDVEKDVEGFKKSNNITDIASQASLYLTSSVDFEKELATVSFDKTVLTPEKLAKVVEATADGKSYKVSNMKI